MVKRKSILNVVHEPARGLRNAGLMEAQTMREFDVLCRPRVKEYTVPRSSAYANATK